VNGGRVRSEGGISPEKREPGTNQSYMSWRVKRDGREGESPGGGLVRTFTYNAASIHQSVSLERGGGLSAIAEAGTEEEKTKFTPGKI